MSDVNTILKKGNYTCCPNLKGNKRVHIKIYVVSLVSGSVVDVCDHSLECMHKECKHRNTSIKIQDILGHEETAGILKRSVCHGNISDEHVDEVEELLMEEVRKYCPPGSHIERELIEGDERFGRQHYRLILVSSMTWKEVIELIQPDHRQSCPSSRRLEEEKEKIQAKLLSRISPPQFSEEINSLYPGDQGGMKMADEPKVVNSETITGNCGASVIRLIWDNGKVTYKCTVTQNWVRKRENNNGNCSTCHGR